jgi:hypothetical protein
MFYEVLTDPRCFVAEDSDDAVDGEEFARRGEVAARSNRTL